MGSGGLWETSAKDNRHEIETIVDDWYKNTQASFRVDSGKVPQCDTNAAREVFWFKICTAVDDLYPNKTYEEKREIANELCVRSEDAFVDLDHSFRNNDKEWTKPMRYAATNGVIEHILFSARKEALSPDAPIIIPSADKFTRLVLPGGGGKGAVYPLALKMLLKDNPELFDKENLTVVGSSAGGLAAALVATGCNLEELPTVLANLQSMALQFGSNHGAAYPSISMPGASIFPAAEIIRYLDVEIGRRIKTFLANLNLGEIRQNCNLSDKEMARLEVLRDRNLEDVSTPQEDKMPTFADLALLRKIGAPFHNLEVTLYNETAHEEIYASAENTPDLPIAFAARGTMALPLMFRAISIPTRLLHPADPANPANPDDRSVIVDGGIGDNIPVGNSAPSRNILVLAFHKDGDEFKKIESAQYALGTAEALEERFVTQTQNPLVTLVTDPEIMNRAVDLLEGHIGGGFISFFLHWTTGGKKDTYDRESYLRIAAVANGMENGVVKMLLHGTIGTLTINPTSRQQAVVDETSRHDIQALVDQTYLERGVLADGRPFGQTTAA
ncbi:MAG: patatin-like phospholipase family protein [Puniceicoccales bacterium]|jgi:predicted acylesterase/phospholipase RssA|nr:patatin-like phospholipase family protein [Puniceicoccales bacterium]